MALILWRGTPASIVVVVIAVVRMLLFVAAILVGMAVVMLAIGVIDSVAAITVAIDAVVAAIIPGGRVLLPVGLATPLYSLLRRAWEYHVTTDTVLLWSRWRPFRSPSPCRAIVFAEKSSWIFPWISCFSFWRTCQTFLHHCYCQKACGVPRPQKYFSQDISESLNSFLLSQVLIYIFPLCLS
jgi:hypothetical protein